MTPQTMDWLHRLEKLGDEAVSLVTDEDPLDAVSRRLAHRAIDDAEGVDFDRICEDLKIPLTGFAAQTEMWAFARVAIRAVAGGRLVGLRPT